ncbi:MAG: pyridoxal-phosphate dependent enzyme [Acidobacteriota bacterium]
MKPASFASESLPDLADMRAAAVRIAPWAHRTPVLTSRSLNRRFGATLFFKAENLQRAGAFKFRGACNSVFSLTEGQAARGVLTHSSGNHGAALALAARERGIPSWVVMPDGAPEVKVAAVRGYGATVVECGATQGAREEAAARLQVETGASFIHPYDDPRVIAGQGTAALELLDQTAELDRIIVPVGGGGLLSGTAIAVGESAPGVKVWAAEPATVDDAYRSFRAGRREAAGPGPTVADGLRTTLSPRTFRALKERVSDVIRVEERDIIEAMRWAWERLKTVIEPSAAVPLAALLAKAPTSEERIGIVLTGGNVDLQRLPWSV